MSQPDKNTISPADPEDLPCQRFEQQLDACLDGRGSMSTLASDPHLGSCSDCRITFDVYRQFDRAGGAVLNGGAGTLSSNRTKRSPISNQRWLPLSSLAVAAALMIYVVASPPSGESNNQFAAIGSSNLVSETSMATEADSSDVANDVSHNLWNSNYVNQLRSAAGEMQQQPMAEPLCEVGKISQRLLSSSLGGWEKSWQYTSELPGIRPFHRSVNVALVLYNDSITLL